MMNPDPVLLFRKLSRESQAELDIAKRFFTAYQLRCAIPPKSLVIPRYATLPFPLELERDLELHGSKLINSYTQHQWIADFEYYRDERIQELTPQTWFPHEVVACKHTGPFVVKGATNSKKWDWDSMMFAETKEQAIEIGSKLRKDSMIGEQEIVIREFVPLKTYEKGINGLPFTNEWRFFFLRHKLLCKGYYWSCADQPSRARLEPEGENLAQRVADIAQEFVNFFVVDIAQTEKGNWILIEINDGTMSGLSEIDPTTLYRNLREALKDGYLK